MTSHLLKTLREVLMDAVHVSFDFFKVLIPISIAMKILAELDWIRYLALPLEPVMQLTGLPADLGIAWATGIMVNFYSALIVFIGLLPGLPPLTTEQGRLAWRTASAASSHQVAWPEFATWYSPGARSLTSWSVACARSFAYVGEPI